MPLRKCFAFLFVLGYCVCVNAQSRKVEGFVVTNSNDTINGFIYSKSLRNGTAVCKFKKSQSPEVNNFHPFEIKSFGKDSTLFESRKEYLRKSGKTGLSEFYKIVFDGKLDILLGNNNKFFIGTDTSRLIYYLNRKDFLYYLTNDQPELRPLIEEMKFTESKFVDLMIAYHNSLNITDYKAYLKNYSDVHLDIFAIGGYNLSFLTTQAEIGKAINYSTSYSPMVGYGVDFFPSFRSREAIFSINLQNRFLKELFQNQSVSQFGGSATYNDILYEGFVFEMPLGFKFQRFIKRNAKLYVMPGFIFKKYIPNQARTITDDISNGEVTTTVIENEYYTRSSALSFFISMGIEKKLKNKKKVFIDLNADRMGTFEFQRYSLSLSIGYKFLSFKFDGK